MKKYLALALLTAAGTHSLQAADTTRDWPTPAEAAKPLSRRAARIMAAAQKRESDEAAGNAQSLQRKDVFDSACEIQDITHKQLAALTMSVANVQNTLDATNQASTVLTKVQDAERERQEALEKLDKSIETLTTQEAEKKKQLADLEAQYTKGKANLLQRTASLERHSKEKKALEAALEEKNGVVTAKQESKQNLDKEVIDNEALLNELREKYRATEYSLARARKERIALAGPTFLNWLLGY
ncbi:MAG: hypothetical protein K2X90_02305 [Candidatus Babeliaceae bacterium]|nr:hypothetical protein [Candidatus Babeliaceae bacterium]